MEKTHTDLHDMKTALFLVKKHGLVQEHLMKKFTEKYEEMTCLMNEVDSLCNQLHEAFQTISPEDYAIFGPMLRIVIAKLKALKQESQNQSSFTCHDVRIEQQLFDLEELEHDIKVFRVDAQKNESLKKAMENVAKLDFSKLARA